MNQPSHVLGYCANACSNRTPSDTNASMAGVACRPPRSRSPYPVIARGVTPSKNNTTKLGNASARAGSVTTITSSANPSSRSGGNPALCTCGSASSGSPPWNARE